MAAEKQGSPTTTKKRTTGPPILPPINDNVSCLGLPQSVLCLRMPFQQIAPYLASDAQFCVCTPAPPLQPLCLVSKIYRCSAKWRSQVWC